MNAKQLLTHFDRLAEAPDAVPRLRRFILDLAARGKLVEQDAGDEPAVELLKKILKIKRELIHAKLIKKSISSVAPLNENLSSEFPKGWTLSTLGEIYDVRDGTHATPKYVDVGFPLVTSKNLYSGRLDFVDVKMISEADHLEISQRSRVDKNDILFAMIGSIGNPVIVDTDRPFSIKNVALFKYYDAALSSPQFLHLFLRHAAEGMRTRATGGLQPFVSLGMLRNSGLALPPLAEQHRIVAKVDELMALCDQLEAAQQERERYRDRLAAASLQRLNQPAADVTLEAQREHARFHLQHLPRLVTRPEQVKAMRQLLLNLAVRGKLVEQHARDEPATVLINRIESEKERLVRDGIAGKQETFRRIPEVDTLFSIPSSWTWVPATYPAYVISDLGKKMQTKDVLSSGEFPVVDQGKVFIRGYCNDQDKVIRVSAPLVLFGDHTRETKLIDFDFVVGADGVKLLQPVCLLTRYYFLALQWLPLDSRGYGRHFKMLKSASIPLPPLAEQPRIVAKVDELMALCDQLEVQLATTQTDSRRLLEAVLEAALV